MAVLVLADTESRADLGRVVNAMQAAREFQGASDDLELLFDVRKSYGDFRANQNAWRSGDGGTTQWVGELEDEDHDYHALYRAVREDLSVCDYCVSAYGVDDAVAESDLERRDEFGGHPSPVAPGRRLRGHHLLTVRTESKRHPSR